LAISELESIIYTAPAIIAPGTPANKMVSGLESEAPNMSEGLYLKLRQFLDDLPGGYPATESGVEIKILKKLFSTEQAELFVKMIPYPPEPPENIAERWGMGVDEALEKVEVMAMKGLCNRVRIGDAVRYMPMQFMVGIYEFQLNSLDRELCELMEEYFPALGEVWKSTKTKQLRIAPHAGAIDARQKVATYDMIRDQVGEKEKIAVAPCICRQETELMGHPCERPHEVCMMFDFGADYFVENGMAKRIDVDEAMKLLDLAEESGLVLSTTNAERIQTICMCCGCCCGVLRMLRKFDRPADHYDSSFQAKVDPEQCAACGTCEDRCQIDAITPGDVYEVDEARCIGCGLCVTTCPEEAMSMVPRQQPNQPPKGMGQMLINIMKDRGKM